MSEDNKSTRFLTGISLPSLLTIVFVVLKLCKVISWSWVWVLAPLWISLSLELLIILIIFIVAAIQNKK